MRHFLFGIHCHQPLDNFHNVLNIAVNQSYLPFLQTVVRYPNFKFAVHYSGWLLEYLKNYSKETFRLLQQLAESGQAEFFSGGYYEPILAAIPSPYRRLQVNKLNTFIEEHFGQKPKGLWLTERVWDSSIVPDLVECGIEYVIVDDYHFISSGFTKETLYGYYQTEQDGYRIKIFPIDQKLRYMVPYKEVPEIDEYFATIPDDRDHAAVIFDDGEKFGLWPNSFNWVYEKGWLERFLAYITSQQHVVAAHFSDFAANEKPLGLVYLPSVSYHEMGEWALFADKFIELTQVKEALKDNGLQALADTYVKGSIWQNFMVKYPESNRMHKRSLALARQSLEFNNADFNETVCKTQVNDALWHGIFGGLYLPNLRNNVYHYIIDADSKLDKLSGAQFPLVEEARLNFDGFAKVSLRTAAVNAIFDMRDNGQMVAFENRFGCFNYQNTLARHYEGYHAQMLQKSTSAEKTHELAEGEIATIHEAVLEIDENIKQYLHFDWYNRNSFVDHVVEAFDFTALKNCAFHELSDLTNRPADAYEIDVENTAVTFTKAGGIFDEAEFYSCNLKKRFAINAKDELHFKINLKGNLKKAYTYVLEFNFHFNDFNAVSINGQLISADFQDKNYAFTIGYNNAKALKLTFDKEVELWAAMINTVSQSEKDVDLTPQGLAIYVPFAFVNDVEITGILQILG